MLGAVRALVHILSVNIRQSFQVKHPLFQYFEIKRHYYNTINGNNESYFHVSSYGTG